MPDTDNIKLTQHWLGLKPYILLEFVPGDEGPDDLRVGIDWGGAVDTPGDVGVGLALALSGLDPADNPLNVELDDLVRDYPEHADIVAVIRSRFGWDAPEEH